MCNVNECPSNWRAFLWQQAKWHLPPFQHRHWDSIWRQNQFLALIFRLAIAACSTCGAKWTGSAKGFHGAIRGKTNGYCKYIYIYNYYIYFFVLYIITYMIYIYILYIYSGFATDSWPIKVTWPQLWRAHMYCDTCLLRCLCTGGKTSSYVNNIWYLHKNQCPHQPLPASAHRLH